MYPWKSRRTMSKSSPRAAMPAGSDDDDGNGGGGGGMPITLPFPFSLGGSSTNIYSQFNHIYFNEDITSETCFALARELRQLAHKLKSMALSMGTEPQPIYLHMTTNGGCIHSAFTVVDAIRSLGVPVYSVVEGFVASAGTLISISAEKRFISPNAYMLLHELRSGVWGKMSSLNDEFANLRKIMDHIIDFYLESTRLKRKQLDGILSKDIIWNAEECMRKGVVDEIYSPAAV